MPILYTDFDAEERDIRERYHRVDAYEDGPNITIYTTSYPVISKTPCGVWIDTTYYMGSYSKRFINNSWRKRWACPTVEEALQSFIARKECQIRKLKYQLQSAEGYFRAAEKCVFDPDGYFRYKVRHYSIPFNFKESSSEDR